MNDTSTSTATGGVTQDYRWILRYSVIAFSVLTGYQIYGVMRLVPRIQLILKGFGADLPAVTAWAIENYAAGCAVTALFSLFSTAYVIAKLNNPSADLRLGYLVSIISLAAASAWSGWVVSAMYEPIFRLGAPI
jgi:type II secretory pathway component PulF